MKKFVAFLMALIMVLAMCSAAQADTVVEVEEKRTYNAYKLLGLTTSLKGDEHHPDTCDGANHADDCYNYSYTVTEKYRSILQAEAFANGGNYLWGENQKPASASLITDDQILKYLSNQTNTMRVVADRLYRAIVAANLDKDVVVDGTASISEGYWMFADVTNFEGQPEANSLVIVATQGEQRITITPKDALPVLEKKVKDIEDSEDSNILDNPWHDSADHDIGDTIPFKVTGTVAGNASSFQTYKMVFHDTLSAGLTFKAGSVKVYKYDTKHKADADTDLNDYQSGNAQDVTTHFTVDTSTDAYGVTTIKVSCANVLATSIGASADNAFVVYYEAQLNTKAVIGAAGNPNTAYLEFSNDAYSNSTGETKEDKVIVFTYKLIVNKIDSHGHDLEGAGFTLYKKALNAADYTVVGGGELTGTDMTTFSWAGLDEGDYKLVETTVPEGYNRMDDVLFSITATHSETADEPALLSLDGGLMGVGDVDENNKPTGTITKKIVNQTGTVLPETGAKGTVMLIGCSSMVVILAAVVMITRKKMSVYED